MSVPPPLFGLCLSLLSLGCGEQGPAPAPPVPTEPAVAEEGWTPDPWDPSRFRSDHDPILSPSRHRAWAQQGVRCPEVAPAGDHRALWFTWWNHDGQTGLGRALQVGELWAIDPAPALSARRLEGVDSLGCVAWLAEPDGSLRGWVDATDDHGRTAIYALTSPDGRSVVFDDRPVLKPHGPWDELELGEPSVVRDGDTLRMYVRCGTPEESGVCTATSRDGRSWGLHEGSVIFRGDHRQIHQLYSPFAVLFEGTWHLWVGRQDLLWHKGEAFLGERDTGAPAFANPQRFAILHAASKDPTRFEIDDMPVVHKPGRHRWDRRLVGDPCIERIEGGVVAWVWGSDDPSRGDIGRAFAQEKPTTLETEAEPLGARALGPLTLTLHATPTGEEIVADGLTYRLRRLPAGTFVLGSPPEERGRDPDETPHDVQFTRPLLMAETEVTQALWAAVTGTAPAEFPGRDRPVEQVSWDDAIRFCDLLSVAVGLEPAYRDEPTGLRCIADGPGFRLPSEAEWEYAARAGGENALYATTGELSAGAWWRENSGGQTHPVGTLAPNAWGLHDMTGNVYEWVWDFKAPYPPTLQMDPLGPFTGTEFKVERGGSFRNGKKNIRIANRGRFPHDARSMNLGLRICRTAPVEP
ncbi:MAG: SUMF1/EgtB/PvdO family nonheme iron enzyme [Pseudomonadota bacterium]